MANYQLIADRYNSLNRKFLPQWVTGKALTIDEQYGRYYEDTHVSATMEQGTGENDWFASVSLVSEEKVSIQNGFNAVFKLNEDMSFGKNQGGVNGIVSFAWTSCYMGVQDVTDNFYHRALADHLAFCTYEPSSQNFDDETYYGGGLGPALWGNKSVDNVANTTTYYDYGFTLTLYPDKDAYTREDIGARSVKHFKLCVKKLNNSVKNNSATAHIVETKNNVIVYEDDLPDEVDLSQISSIALSARDNMGYINIFLNGVNIVSFYVEDNCDLKNLDQAYFTTCVMGDAFSKPSFTIYSINGVLAAFHGDIVGQIETKFNELTSVSKLSEVSANILNSIVTDFPDENDDPEEYDELYHDVEMKNVVSNWLSENV